MSLINEMLRDLEARRAAELGKTDLLREIRPLPTRRQPPRRSLAVVMAGLLAASVAGWGVWAWYAGPWSFRIGVSDKSGSVPAVVGAGGAASPAPVEVSSAAVAEAIRLAEGGGKDPAPPVAAPQPEPTAPQEPKSEALRAPVKGDGGALGLIVSTSLQGVPASTLPPKAAAAITGGPAAQGHIEKTPVLGTPRERADAEYKRAQALISAGGSAAAVADSLQGALRQDPTFGPARQALLRLFLESRRVEEAMVLLQEGLEHQPGQVGWAMSLARLQVERGDWAGGERTLARSHTHGAASPEFLGFHGYLLHRLGLHKEAAEKYLLAARMGPADGRWWFGLGQSLEADGRHDDARAAYRRAADSGNLSADLMMIAEQKSR